MNIVETIQSVNNMGGKALSVFLTAGYPDKNTFVSLASRLLDAGADMLEIGIPFSDPIADGPVIQHSSFSALKNGVTVRDCLKYAEEIKKQCGKPLVAMSYANPLLAYGMDNFLSDAVNAGFDGLIIPDMVIEEYGELLPKAQKNLDVILLCTPTSPAERIKEIDRLSQGFVYCVSLTGTTGVRNTFDGISVDKVKEAYSLMEKNRMLVGFGISKPADVALFSPHCDGVITGSAVVKLLEGGTAESYDAAEQLVRDLKAACLPG